MNYRFVMLLEETDEFFYTVYIRKITPVKLLMRAVSLLSKEQIKLLLRGAAASALGNLISSHRHKREIFLNTSDKWHPPAASECHAEKLLRPAWQ